ncbi:excisionase family DNA-binding protein [Mycolicibacterium austroafricanum]|uniref:Excisionase family DNA-binding protein n=1 Tax=Mycolicibacterium austroafricanum TaxID=39687 RepID=A0ABT8HLE0_MYCAO|nr:excisionase family DNA-binding protein [Mycolicibacterium austroafricanum]MDN4521569.1 excisionase family DNA-binding protein [Mycolicibacterium austroafricanum]QRZ09392.1 excisionase family DNA-binding protein [Mycolicibacterium austroafricanum]QZT70510.1 excisionase family DNA-binding protein [Mycolicibacterium austroafricanum]
MTDSADQLAIAIRQIVKESVDAALRAQVQPRISPSEPTKSIDDSTGRLLYSFKEIQSKLNIGRSTLYQLLDDGQLPSVRIGRRRLVTAAAVTEYVKGLA